MDSNTDTTKQTKVSSWMGKAGRWGLVEYKVKHRPMYRTTYPSIYNAVQACKAFSDDYVHRGHDYITSNFGSDEPGWSGFSSAKELEHKCLNGVDFDKETRPILEPMGYRPDMFTDTIVYGMTGVECDVQEFVYGNPECMMFEESAQPRPVLHIVFNGSVDVSWSASRIRTYSTMFMKCLKALELSGYRLHITYMDTTVGYGGATVQNCIDLNSPGEPLDWKCLLFPLTHPAFLRGLLFNLLAIVPHPYPGGMGGTGRVKDFLTEWDESELEQYDYIFDLEYCPDTQEEVWKDMVTAMGIYDQVGDWQD